MKRPLVTLLLASIATLIRGCSDPESPTEEHLKKLWQLPINGSIQTNFTVTDLSLIFKTSGNKTGKTYKVSKDGKSVQSDSTGGCTVGAPLLDGGVLYSNSCTSLYALRANDLSTIWSQSVYAWIPIPAADANYLFVTDLNLLSALDKMDGHVIWSKPMVGKNASNPVIEGDTLYFATSQLFADGYLYAVNKTDGTIKYRITIPYIQSNAQEGGSYSGVEIWNDRIFVSGLNRIFYCFRKADGQIIWSFTADAPMEVSPRISEGTVYFGTLNRTCYALDASTGKKRWSFQGGGSIILEPSFYRSFVMFKSIGALLILEKGTGKEVLKMAATTTEFGFSSAFWDEDGIIYACGTVESNHQNKLVAYQFR